MKTIGIGRSHRRIVAFAATFVFLGTLTLAGPAVASPITDTTTANFSAGTTAGTYVSETGNGEVILAPTEGSEFFGSALPAGWFEAPWSGGGDASVSGGKLKVDGASAGTTATYGPARVLEFSATFPSSTPYAHIGFGVDYNDPPWAMFSLKSDGTFWARTQASPSPPGPPGVETALPASLLDSPHVYRIVWEASEVRYYVDDALVATHGVTLGVPPLRVLASDLHPAGGSLSIDWVRMTPYSASGNFESRVFDAGEPVVWGSLNWNADKPVGTTVKLYVRTGNTPVPDGTWSAFQEISSPGADVPGFSHYAQYRAVLSTTNPVITPTLSDVTIDFAARADLKLTKTATPTNPKPGDTVTYTLKAENIGGSPAEDVVITDTLPVGVTFDWASAPCNESAGTVTCEIAGPLAPGEHKTVKIKVIVDEWGTADPVRDHMLDVQKVEAQIDLEPGQQKTVSVTCPSGYFATDGSVRIDHVDQGTGDWTAPQVLESRASSLDTWRGTVRNTATGRAQAKIFAVCVKKTTDDAGAHTHNLTVSAPVTHTDSYPAGKANATLQCGPGQIAIQPGFRSSKPGLMTYSQPQGNGWKFVLDLKEPADVTFSIRCLNRQLSGKKGHTHDLMLERIWTEVTVEPGNVNEAQLTCADGYKGILAGWDLDHGLVSLGNDPRPVTRAYKLYNPTDKPLKARLSLLCLGDRTYGEHAVPQVIVNDASVSTSSSESDTANNSSSATVTAEETDIFTPVPNPPPIKPTPNNPIATTIVGKGVTYSARSVFASIRCSAACSGSAKLVTTGAVRVGGRTVKKGSVLARGSYGLGQAGSAKVRLKLNRKGLKLVKGRKLGRGLVRLSSGQSAVVRIRR